MPVENSPPANITRSQRHQSVLTLIVRAPLDCTPAFHQLSTNLDRGTPIFSQGPRNRLGEAEDEEGEEYEETEVAEASAGAPEASEAPNLAPFN
ncbi:hypothetical protein O181_040948 [Austropuccinia psidii MF-1]|uniref:Uncharacterized protein n=1 Tax=Austropuccinia psidii MF-1 TaxID=1389203 RepID=A0A9Q3HDC9_9BASI|nr:hypothetical protein [Austropuccinia psidii MF-1]